jgi:hypothetical protein
VSITADETVPGTPAPAERGAPIPEQPTANAGVTSHEPVKGPPAAGVQTAPAEVPIAFATEDITAAADPAPCPAPQPPNPPPKPFETEPFERGGQRPKR